MILNGKTYEVKDVKDYFNKCELCDLRDENGLCPIEETCRPDEFFKEVKQKD